MNVDRPFFITGHAIERFQERVCHHMPRRDVIKNIQNMLQSRSGLVQTTAKRKKLKNVYHKTYKGKHLYIVIIFERNKTWPTVVTVLGEESAIHQKYISGEAREIV